MLTDWRLWKRYPILLIVRFAQNTIRTTALLFFILVLSLITTTMRIDQLPIGFIGVSLGLNWLLMIYFGWKLKRFKIMLYPVMFILNPFFNWYYMVYGIFTAGQRTWGGPRADAATANQDTTPQQAIEKAENTGDDLNIVPETFIPATEIQRGNSLKEKGVRVPRNKNNKGHLLPPEKIEGKFAAPEKKADGFYVHDEDSRYSFNTLGESSYDMKSRLALQHRESWESFLTTGNNSVYLPRRVESIMGDEDRKKYELAQASQYNQFVENSRKYPPPGQVYEIGDIDMSKTEWDVGRGATAAEAERPENQQRPRSHDSSTSSHSSRARSPGPVTPPISRGHSSRSARQSVRLQSTGSGRRTGRSPLANERLDA